MNTRINGVAASHNLNGVPIAEKKKNRLQSVLLMAGIFALAGIGVNQWEKPIGKLVAATVSACQEYIDRPKKEAAARKSWEDYQHQQKVENDRIEAELDKKYPERAANRLRYHTR